MSQGAGDGGWPTIRYFNKQTGYGGKGYKQKTSEALDAELGDMDKMRQYVEEKSGSSSCDVVWGNDCSDMELKYIGKYIGHSVPRSKVNVQQEKDKWEQELQGKWTAQNKQRTVLLSRVLANFDNPEL